MDTTKPEQDESVQRVIISGTGDEIIQVLLDYLAANGNDISNVELHTDAETMQRLADLVLPHVGSTQ